MVVSEEKSRVAREKTRGPNGKFVKGVSGNPKGRPKKEKVNKDDLPENFADTVGSDAKKALEALLASTTSRYEAQKIAKDLLPYQTPKLSNVESYSTEIKTIEIKWLTEDVELPLTIEGHAEIDESTE